MSQSLRTPLGRVRGLGASREGVGHFIAQRVSAIALVFLVPWFMLSLIGAAKGGYDGAVEWIGQPLNAVLILLAVGAGLYHMRLGMQVVIEDYLARPLTKNFKLIASTFLCVFLFAVAAFSVLKIAG
ncbi:MAG: succinate dehydrogenase, hydrophobic membrane anchor protein [Hyphomonadaceae bacterium]